MGIRDPATGRFLKKGELPGDSGVIVKDRGWKKIVAALLKPPRVAKVGVQGDEAMATYEEGWSNVTNAAVHEFGTIDGRVPERSFLRSTFDENLQRYESQSAKSAKAILGGEAQTDGELLLLGESYRADILRKIKGGIQPGLAESTKAGKSSLGKPRADYGDVPLKVTGQFWKSIGVQVVNAGEVER